MDAAYSPLVSITIPSFNQGRYIKETVDSILSQDYPNLEVLIMDGGSKDETLKVLEAYAGDPRVRVRSEPDKGQCDAINKGFAASRGEILAWLGSDDTYLPGALGRQVRYLMDHPEADVVYGDAVYTRSDGERCGTYHGRPFSPAELCRLCFIPQPSLFMRRAVYERSGPLDVTVRYALDYEYWLRSMIHSSFAYNPGFVATYRLHSDSKTVSGETNFNPEIERFVLRALDDPRAPETLKRHRKDLLADLYLGLGNGSLRSGDKRGAMRYLRLSLRHRLARPRLAWFLVYLALGTETTNSLAQKWARVRSKARPA
jgi:glycosyltransferase involved in cell wall biosynthesis